MTGHNLIVSLHLNDDLLHVAHKTIKGDNSIVSLHLNDNLLHDVHKTRKGDDSIVSWHPNTMKGDNSIVSLQYFFLMSVPHLMRLQSGQGILL